MPPTRCSPRRDEFVAVSHVAGAYSMRGGNLVRPLIDGVPAFRRIGQAVEHAVRSVWLTIAFYADDFAFPDGGGSLFTVLDQAARRGLDVRVLFWRPNEVSRGYGRTFSGTPEERRLLLAREARFSARWDRAAGPHCQHQKSWLVDAGCSTEVAFVGGINLTAKALGSPGHADGGRHDVYLELAGPCATDVHHNFVQRWNEASDRDDVDGTWGPAGQEALPFPSRASVTRGDAVAQVQRMIPAGRYTDGTAAPGVRPTTSGTGKPPSWRSMKTPSAPLARPSTSRPKHSPSRVWLVGSRRRSGEGSNSSWSCQSRRPKSEKAEAGVRGVRRSHARGIWPGIPTALSRVYAGRMGHSPSQSMCTPSSWWSTEPGQRSGRAISIGIHSRVTPR